MAEMDAALVESLRLNGRFVDGIGRVAFFATDVSVRMSGWRLSVDADEARAHLIGALERRSAEFARLVSGIRESIVSTSDGR